MLYILAYEELGNHPKTIRCARALGINRAQMVGHLYFLWIWCLHYAPDGDVTRYENADIAHAAEWEGDADKFVQALIGCGVATAPGWMEEKDGLLVLHDWDDYGGKVLQGREKHAETMRIRREKARDYHVTITDQSRDELLPSRDRLRIDKEKNRKELTPHSPPGGEVDNFKRFFENEVWKVYPERNGKKIGKAATMALVKKIPSGDWEEVVLAVRNYAASSSAARGFARDPARFFQAEYWREWIKPEVSNSNGANGSGVSDETYSFDVDEQTGKRIPLAGHWATGQLPYGAHTPAEVMQIHKGKLRERRNGGTAH